ncbi:hypothetical protein HYH03_019164, partial [Edaphochlamys debaryana]
RRRRAAAGSVLQIEQLRALTSELKAGGQAEAADWRRRWRLSSCAGSEAEGRGAAAGEGGGRGGPPPRRPRWLLLLGGCSNPACANLEGDSDVALPLRACAGCGGAASYCSRECQTAHWRSGHRRRAAAALGAVGGRGAAERLGLGEA